jgi:hypothetical protein
MWIEHDDPMGGSANCGPSTHSPGRTGSPWHKSKPWLGVGASTCAAAGAPLPSFGPGEREASGTAQV